METDSTELTPRDYIPLYGVYKYFRRNDREVITGLAMLINTVARFIDRRPVRAETSDPYLRAKHAAERMFLIAAYNALVIDLTCGVVIDVAKTIGGGLEKLVN